MTGNRGGECHDMMRAYPWEHFRSVAVTLYAGLKAAGV
jgi:hypothetical protein